jgi:FkbM family methyltransferase
MARKIIDKLLKNIDCILTVLLDRLGLPTVNRIPYNCQSREWGPVNPGREQLSDAIARLLKGKSITGIIDCGAFEGHLSRLYTKMFPEAIIYAFEPVPETFARLQESSISYPHIKAINQGVGRSTGKTLFYQTAHPGSSSLLPPSSTGLHYYPDLYPISNQYEVDLTSLNDWWQSAGHPAIQFIKLDVQGGELDLLKGATELLEKAGVELIQTEVMFLGTYARQGLFSEVEIFLRHRGFSLYQFYEVWTHPDGQIAGCDALFRKKVQEIN